MSAAAQSTTAASLRSPWPQVGRLFVIAVAILGVIIAILSFTVSWDAMATICQEADSGCPGLFTVNQAEVLTSMGFSITSLRWIGVIISVILTSVFFIVAGLILWRRSDNWIGLLTALMFVLIGTQAYTGNTLYLTQQYPALRYPVAIMSGASLALLIPFMALFPNGRFVPRWTKPLTIVATPFMLLANNGYGFQPPLSYLIFSLTVGGLLFGLVAQVIRYRRFSSPIERQQTKWVLIGLAFLFSSFVFLTLLIVLAPGMSPLVQVIALLVISIVFPLSLLSIPISIGASLLRYRLWDIDFVVNRSLVYGALTLLLAAIFGGSLFLASRFVSGQSFIVAFGVTVALAGALFNPARKRIQRFVDRRFYHIYIEYDKTPLTGQPARGLTQVMRQTSFGEYRNLELVGQGGMAEVYKSTHPALDLPVAIKLLPARLAGEADFRQRFIREAQVLASLQHPNIVRIFDYGEHEGTLYIVMEFLAGGDLGSRIGRQGRLPVERSGSILRQVADALDYAHAQGLVHRDIKPSNVMFDTAGESDSRAVLTDFGIAKVLNARTALTGTGGLLGTLDYIAPEQIQGAADVDGRADIYSLGVMAYQMVTGELPFTQHNPGALLLAHMNHPPPDASEAAPGCPPAAGAAIQRAMAKKPGERYQTAGEFATAISAG